jgi:hypothetical protein
MKMQYKFPYIFFLALFLIQVTLSFGQDNEPTTGPVFNNIGAVYSIDSLDFLPENPGGSEVTTVESVQKKNTKNFQKRRVYI